MTSTGGPTGLVSASAVPLTTLTEELEATTTLPNGQTTLIKATRSITIVDASQYTSILASEAAASQTTASSIPSSSSSSAATSSHQTTNSNTATLSTAADIAIGVGTALGVILLLTIAVLLFRCHVQVSLKPRKKAVPAQKSTGKWMWIGAKAELEAKDGTEIRHKTVDAEMCTEANSHEADSRALPHQHGRQPKDRMQGLCELAADTEKGHQ